jgi:hypothetical protein
VTPITYTSDQPGDYAKALDAADSLGKLREVTAEWALLAEDAKAKADAMTEQDFERFRKGLKKERRGQFAGEEFAMEFEDLMMPAVMFKVAIAASEYKVPFGLMYIRMKETGNLPASSSPSDGEVK